LALPNVGYPHTARPICYNFSIAAASSLRLSRRYIHSVRLPSACRRSRPTGSGLPLIAYRTDVQSPQSYPLPVARASRPPFVDAYASYTKIDKRFALLAGRAGPGRHLGRLAAQSVRFILPITSAQYSLVGRRNTYGREHQSYGGQYFAQAAPTITTLAIFSCRSRQMLPLILPENVSENAGVKITLLPSVKTRNVRYRTRKSIPGREKDNLSFLSNAGSRRSGTCWSSDAGSGQNEHVLRRPFLCCCCTACLEQFARCCP